MVRQDYLTEDEFADRFGMDVIVWSVICQDSKVLERHDKEALIERRGIFCLTFQT